MRECLKIFLKTILKFRIGYELILKKILDYVNAQEKAKDKLKNIDKDGASTIVGATKEDYDYLGIGGLRRRKPLRKIKRKRWQNGHERSNECIKGLKKVYKLD